MLYPYDSQTPSLKLQSLDHGKNEISLSTKTLNSLNNLSVNKTNVKDIHEVSHVQDRFSH